MDRILKPAVMVFITMACAGTVAAQQNEYKWMLGVHAGTMIYQGDLTPSRFGSYKTASFALGISAGKILSPYFAIRANAVLGKLNGNDAVYDNPLWRKSRSFMFQSSVTELNAQLLWNPFGNNSNETGQRFTPYLFAGSGVSFVNISRDYSRMDTAVFGFNTKVQNGLRADTARSLPRTLFVLPVGAGISYFLGERWTLNYELGFRYTFTDYLDGFSQAANPGSKDFYHTQTLGLVYRFGGSKSGGGTLGCPVMKY